MVVRHEECDGCLHPNCEYGAQDVGTAGAAELKRIENRGVGVHAARHIWCATTAPAASV